MADFAKKRITGDRVYFVLNRHVNPTNICVLSCKFCDFAKKPGDSDAYEMSIEEILDHVDDDIHEIHIVGGHHPTWPFEYYVEMVKAIHEKAPHVQIKGFTASEIDYFQRRWKVTPEESLAILKEAGLQSMPGGGAEVFSSRVHKILLPGKANADRWAEIHKTAHRMDIPTNCTLLYGHIESFEERVEHLAELRRLQDKTRGFQTYIPLAFHPDNTPKLSHLPFPGPTERLRSIAVGRLFLDNIPNIKAYWVMMGLPVAQLALSFGANDLDGTVTQEKVYHDAGASTPENLSRARILQLIQEVGRRPVERDTLYRTLQTH